MHVLQICCCTPLLEKGEDQDPPTGCFGTLTGGFWAPVVTRKHLLEAAGIYTKLGNIYQDRGALSGSL